MLKKQLWMALGLVVLALSLHSCFGGGEPTFSQSDLYKNGGLWLEDKAGEEHYVRFTAEQAGGGFMYGREWHEEEDKYESDLVPYGNGWFKYELVQKNLTEIHLMDNGGADIPKEYVVTMLTEDRLEYYEKDYPSIKFKFNKVAEKK